MQTALGRPVGRYAYSNMRSRVDWEAGQFQVSDSCISPQGDRASVKASLRRGILLIGRDIDIYKSLLYRSWQSPRSMLILRLSSTGIAVNNRSTDGGSTLLLTGDYMLVYIQVVVY